MYKIFFLLLLSLSCYGQKLHHQAIVAQGANVKLANNMVVSQSIGQSSAIGNYRNKTVVVGQGFIQSMTSSSNSTPAKKPVSVVVYPNPIVDLATFKFSVNLETAGSITIFDTRGRLVHSQQVQISQSIVNINLSFLAAGVYFVKFETSNSTFSTKIIKS